jgi:predicted ATPase
MVVMPASAASSSFQPPSLIPKQAAEDVFVGRQAELGALQAAFEDTLAGRGRLLMVAGEPGIGKTRTARELAAYAQERGALVLWGRCHESAGAPPYWPWVQILRTYVRTRNPAQLGSEMGAGAADIAAIVPEVRERLPDLPTPPRFADPEQARFRLFDALTTFLQHTSQHLPLVLILDNLHWADKPSLLLLEFLAQEGGTHRLLVLGTYRDVELSRQHPLTETLAELTRERSVSRLLLRGLSREDVARFLAATTGILSSPALVEAIHAQTEGNPLFLTEVVRWLLQEGQLTPEHAPPHQILTLGLPSGVREVIGKRLNRLSSPCNHLLTIAAVIGREFGLKEICRLLDDRPEERVLELLEEALATKVLEEVPQAVGYYQFTHALIQATLYDELTLTRRTYLHRRIGETLEDLYSVNLEPYLARLALHFGEAAPHGDVDKAIDYALRAGERDDTLLAYEEAARHFTMALQALTLQEPVNASKRCQLLLALGNAQRKAGEFPQALETFQRAATSARTLGSEEALAYAAIGFEETSWRPGLFGNVAVRLLTEALESLPAGDSTLKARVLGSLTRAVAYTGAIDQAARVERQAVEMARRLGDPGTLAAALKAPFYALWEFQQIDIRRATVTELIELATAIGDKDLLVQAHIWRLFDLMALGDMEAVTAQLDVSSQLAAELQQPFYLYANMTFRAMYSIFTGHFEAGEQLAQQALAIGQRLRGQDALGVFGVQMFTLRREQGRLQELAPVVKHFVQTSSAASTWRPGLALIYSELGLKQEAQAEFTYLAADDFAVVPRDARWLVCMVYLAEVCAFLGDVHSAAALYHYLRPYEGYNIVVSGSVACYGTASHYLGRLAATMSHWEEAQRHFEDALAMHARMGTRPWLAHTQYEYATMLLRRAQPSDCNQALALLQEALRLSRALDMRALEERVVALQEHVGSQPHSRHSYPCGLSEREVEVLCLLAAGKSNREIADTLYISINTVANHVRNILTKTNTANRTEAATFAIHQGLLESSRF